MKTGLKNAWMIFLFVSSAGLSLGQANVTTQPSNRVNGYIDEGIRVPLPASVHPAIAQATSSQPVDPAFMMSHMILTLRPDAAQQAALDQLLVQQYDPASVNFHKFLTPEQFAASFGASLNDVAKVTSWLESEGFQVEEVAASRLAIVFSGNAEQVASAFSTEIRQYVLNGETHHANASAPEIPLALSSVVSGFASLHDFHTKSSASGLKMLAQSNLQSETTYGTYHYLSPSDYATIYNLNPLYSASVNGTGQSIALIGRSNIRTTDVSTFRAQYGLPANNPSVIIASGTDPGFTADGDAVEATLDVEWAGAVSPKAAIKLVIAASTSTADGVDLAAQYAVNQNVASVISLSFGACEAYVNNSFYNALWQQAAAQGISVFVSAGDSGAAGCQGSGSTYGTARAINGLCSSPYSTCVGGTEFNDIANPGQYWLPGNNAVMGSAIGYIPEMVWNESGSVKGGSDLIASGGGASAVYPKPAWQNVAGVPADGKRDVPDVSLAAAGHDGYLLIFNGSLAAVGGTSASSPSLAGIMSMVHQKNGVQGNASPAFYAISAKQALGGPAAFHDITLGSNSVPGVVGYSAAAGYDPASGLGSVNGAILVNNWSSATALNCTLAGSPTSFTVLQGQMQSLSITCGNAQGTFGSNLSLAVNGLPSGVTANFSPATLAAGTGLSSLSVNAASSAAPGAYTLSVTATLPNSSPQFSRALAVPLTINAPPTFKLTPSTSSLTFAQGASASFTVASAHSGTFNSSVKLTLSGLPAGVTAVVTPAQINAPGDGVTTFSLQSTSNTVAGTYTLLVNGQGGGFTVAAPISLKVIQAPAFTFTSTQNALLLRRSSAATTVNLTVAGLSNGFNAPVVFAATTLPAGVSASFAPASLAAPGSGTTALSLAASSTAATGVFAITVTATGGTLVRSVQLQLTVTPAPTFAIQASLPSYNIVAGDTLTELVSATGLYGYNSNIRLSTAALPAGLTVTLGASTISGAAGSTNVTIQTSATIAVGVYSIVVTGTDPTSGVSQTAAISLLVGDVTTTLSAPTLSVHKGSSASITATVTAQSYSGNVALSTTALPIGITSAFSKPVLPGSGTSTLTISAASTVIPGTYTISVRTTTGAVWSLIPFTIVVTN